MSALSEGNTSLRRSRGGNMIVVRVSGRNRPVPGGQIVSIKLASGGGAEAFSALSVQQGDRVGIKPTEGAERKSAKFNVVKVVKPASKSRRVGRDPSKRGRMETLRGMRGKQLKSDAVFGRLADNTEAKELFVQKLEELGPKVVEVTVSAPRIGGAVGVRVPAEDLVEFLDVDVITQKDAAVDPPQLDPGLWGPAPTADEAETADRVLANLSEGMRETVLADSLTRANAAKRLSVTEQTISDWLAAGRLLGVKRGRTWRLPTWQFDDRSDTGLKSGVTDAYREFGAGVVAFSSWATSASDELGGVTPSEALAAGKVAEVVAAAHRSGVSW